MRIHDLTPHQLRAAGMVAAGDTDKAIATALHVEVDAVDKLLARIVKAWELDPSKNRRAQITRLYLEKTARNSAA